MKIVITGANGLLGRVFGKFLKNQGHTIFGLDIAQQGTTSTRFNLDNTLDSPLLNENFFDKYITINISDLLLLHKAFSSLGEIDLVIHLAALMETERPEMIKKVNISGTENIFYCCKLLNITKVIYASSIQTVASKILYEEPYRSINSGEFTGNLRKVPKIAVNERILPRNASESVIAYVESKFKGEDLASEYVKHGISTLVLRFGAISSTNIPYAEIMLKPIWCSHEDACLFIQKALERLQKNELLFTKTYYVFSNNANLHVEMENDLGFVANDNSDAALAKHGQSTSVKFSTFNK